MTRNTAPAGMAGAGSLVAERCQMDDRNYRVSLPKGIRPVPTCPKSVISMLSMVMDDREVAGDTALHSLWIRLCCDMDMEPVWGAMRIDGMHELDFVDVVMVFIGCALKISGHDYAFEKKTNVERHAWLKSTRAAALKLQSLLDEGPGLPSENVIERVPLDGMQWLLGGIGVRIVPDDSSLGAYDLPNDRWLVSERALLRAQAGTCPLSMHDLLGMLLDDLDGGVHSTQTISKPRDSKAFRANYILGITEGLRCAAFRLTDEQVATVARVVLQDEAITPALANRFRWRPEKDVPIGAVIQDSSE